MLNVINKYNMNDTKNNIDFMFPESKGFINNKYKMWYISLVCNAINSDRIFDAAQHEKHHILPKSLGGGNYNNIVIFTFREHYIAHLLLTKFTKGKNKSKMCFALHTFFHLVVSPIRKQYYPERLKYKARGKTYSHHKRHFIEACKHRAQQVGALNHNIFIFKHKLSNDEFVGTRYDFTNYSGLSHQEVYTLINYKYKMKHIKQWGVYRTEINDFSFNESRVSTSKYISYKTCPHCNKNVDNRNYTRWHGDRCKQLLTC